MSCEKCRASNQRSFKSELSVAFREHANVNRSPVYICQDISICLDCGHAELAVPKTQLEQLKDETLKSGSRRSTGQEGSLDS
jgi:hypothetical protein